MYRTQLSARTTLICAGKHIILINLLIYEQNYFVEWHVLEYHCEFKNLFHFSCPALALVLYPIVPIITYAVLLWRTPQNLSTHQTLLRLQNLQKIGNKMKSHIFNIYIHLKRWRQIVIDNICLSTH